MNRNVVLVCILCMAFVSTYFYGKLHECKKHLVYLSPSKLG
jgi:hypothetical protein